MIPIEIMPKENTPPFMYVNIKSNEVLSPESQEITLGFPVEGVLRSLPNIKSFKTKVSKNSINLAINYYPSTNMELAFIQMQEGLQVLEDKDILQMKNVTITKFNPESSPIVKVSIQIPRTITDSKKFIEEQIKPGLESIEGVIKLDLSGADSQNFEYDLNIEKVYQLGIDLKQLSSIISLEQVRKSLGLMLDKTSSRLFSVNLRTKEATLKDFTSQSLKKDGQFDVAKFARKKVIKPYEKAINHDTGKKAIVIDIYASEDANLFNINKDIRKYFFKLVNTEKYRDVKVSFILDRTQELKDAISDVLSNLILAILITFLVVFSFKRKLKITILISTIIPLALVMTVMLLYSKGTSLNLLTLSGLILSIGLIVDNAIVVVERIYQFVEQGASLVSAASKGAIDMAIPLLMSTLTTVIIFLPAAFVDSGDSFTDMLKSFQVPVIGALSSSYFLSLLSIPLIFLFLKPKAEAKTDSYGLSSSSKFIFAYLYEKRFISFVLIGLSLWGLLNYISSIEQTDLDSPRDPFVTLSVSFTPETKAKFRFNEFLLVEKELLKRQNELNLKFILAEFSSTYTSGSFSLYPKTDTGAEIDDILDDLKKNLINYTDNRKSKVGMMISATGESIGNYTFKKRKSFKFEGPKFIKLLSISQKIKDSLLGIEGVDRIKLENEEKGKFSFVVVPNKELLKSYNLSTDKIPNLVKPYLNDISAGQVRFNGELIGTKISVKNEYGKWDMESLQNLQIVLPGNRFLRFGDIGQWIPSYELKMFKREAGKASLGLYVYFQDGLSHRKIRTLKAKISGLVNDYSFPKGYGLESDKRGLALAEMGAKTNFVVFLSVFLIYLLLAGLYESFLIPFAILFTVPFAIIFGVLGLKFHGLTLDPMARLGLIILVGIVVNNAIVLVDVIMKLISNGMRKSDAIIHGCSERLGAILMTSTTTIIGILPVAFGNAKIMGIPYSSLGITIMYGMLFSTIITLILLPIAFDFCFSAEEKLKNQILSPSETSSGF